MARSAARGAAALILEWNTHYPDHAGKPEANVQRSWHPLYDFF